MVMPGELLHCFVAVNGQVSAAAAHDRTSRRRLQTLLACMSRAFGYSLTFSWRRRRSIAACSSLELGHDALEIGVSSVARPHNAALVPQGIDLWRDRIPIIVHLDGQ